MARGKDGEAGARRQPALLWYAISGARRQPVACGPVGSLWHARHTRAAPDLHARAHPSHSGPTRLVRLPCVVPQGPFSGNGIRRLSGQGTHLVPKGS
jgi:hypothetical protein